ncbi:MAG: hypothetical protein ACOZB0_00370 [Pseudomonadota bacterium]
MRTLPKYMLLVALAALSMASAQARDRDDNPPGPRGGPGTNWENPRGPAGGPGASPNRRPLRDRDDNPPGPRGGPGTNWENPPGPRGGIGASPDLRKRHSHWLRQRLGPTDWALFIALTPGDRLAYCRKRGIDPDYCWFDRDDNPPGPRGGPGTDWENPPGPVGGPGASPDRR